MINFSKNALLSTEKGNNTPSYCLDCDLIIPFFTKRNQHLFTKRDQSILEEWIIPEMRPEMYRMCVGDLVLPESKETSEILMKSC